MPWYKENRLGNDPAYLEPRLSKAEVEAQHHNRETLDKFAENEEGKPTYNNQPIGEVTKADLEEVNTQLAQIGDLSELDTTEKSNLVNAVNETVSQLAQIEKNPVISVNDKTGEVNLSSSDVGAEIQIHKGPAPPSNTSKLWLDTSKLPYILKHHSGVSWGNASPTKTSELENDNQFRKITFGTAEPTGGVDGDIYFQYE